MNESSGIGSGGGGISSRLPPEFELLLSMGCAVAILGRSFDEVRGEATGMTLGVGGRDEGRGRIGVRREREEKSTAGEEGMMVLDAERACMGLRGERADRGEIIEWTLGLPSVSDGLTWRGGRCWW